ncbi:uncharacterized protein LOC142333711 isoform X2 [Lycorma delicatula]|uniref:uncharacterized protein LOC142333711 isoform X2 n=1 Tax=Lycorma delicatula TaxID=130591 RepID=UPI003F516EC9
MICTRVILVLVLAVSWMVMGAPSENDRLINDVEDTWSPADHPLRQGWLSNSAVPFQPRIRKAPAPLIDDDSSVDNALMNYLFAKEFVNRLRNQQSNADLQRKRSYWKQCAFNAVSCFGK